MKNNRGSSLVEVLAAVTIVALLAAVVAGAMPGMFPRARVQAWRGSMRGLQSACDLFYALWGRYPVADQAPRGGSLPQGGPLASLLDLGATGGDGRPFAAGLRSLPAGDAVQAGLGGEPLPLYYGINRLGRVFATTAAPPWAADTIVFLPEEPGGAPLGTGFPRETPPGQGREGEESSDDGQPPGEGQSPGEGEVPGEGQRPPAGGEESSGTGGGETVQLGVGVAAPDAVFSCAGVREREGALVPEHGPTLGPGCSLPVPVSGAGAALVAGGAYLLGGRGNADGILYQPGPDEEWQLLPTRLPYEAPEATVATVGDRAYLLGGGPGEAGQEVWAYEGVGKPLRRLNCSFPAPLTGATACAHAGKVYVFGGYLGGAPSPAIFAFDPGAEAIDQLPTTLPTALAGAPAVALGEYIYLFGGQTPRGWSDRILRYSPRSGVVEDTRHRLPAGAARSAAAVLEGVVYLLGGAAGNPGNPAALNTLWSYTPERGVDRLTPALSFAPGCWGAAGVVRGGEAYFCGGSSSPAVELARVLRLRREPGSPRPVLTLGAPLTYAGVVAGRGGDIYVVGGAPGIWATEQIRRLTLRDREERVLGFTLPGRIMNAPCARVGNRIFTFGGRNRHALVGGRLSTIAMVDLDSGTARAVASLPRAMEGSAAAAWGDAVYVLGGCTDAGSSDRILRFDPVAFSWEELPVRLPSPRGQAVAVSAPEGIWLVGGRSPAGLLDEVLLFCPVDGSLRQVAHLPLPLERAAAVLWQDRLYVMGGVGREGLSARILEVEPGGSAVREMPRPLPAPACGTAVVVDGLIYLVADGGGVLEVVPRPEVIWRLEGEENTRWRLAEVRGTGVTLSFRASSDGLHWTSAAPEPADLPPGRYLEVKAIFLAEESARLESVRLARR
ncbi:MAG: prepilin-type N-terminal cleavage/methylation domain-containing protein [Bacillota bacterium]|nr:prepilin-type N-terminal cleavage/methylation domain-containing protein [Bacillota bacterium]